MSSRRAPAPASAPPGPSARVSKATVPANAAGFGLVFVDTAEGSRVASVEAQSPLAGRIWPGDVVLMINSRNVSTCSASIIKILLNPSRENVLTIRHDSGHGDGGEEVRTSGCGASGMKLSPLSLSRFRTSGCRA